MIEMACLECGREFAVPDDPGDVECPDCGTSNVAPVFDGGGE